MELDVKIQKLGKIPDVFDFFKTMAKHPNIRNPILLESVEESTQKMMFSFIGVNPDFMIKGVNNNLSIFDVQTEKGEKLKQYCQRAEPQPVEGMAFEDSTPMEMPLLDELRRIFPITRSAIPELFPRKVFAGGLLGYIGYDVIAPYVGYKPSATSQEQFPDILMGLYSNSFAYSHSTGLLYLITNSVINSQSISDDAADLIKIVDQYKDKPMPGVAKASGSKKSSKSKVSSAKIDLHQIKPVDANLFKTNTTLEQWVNMITKVKENVMAGDIIQSVLSRKMYIDSEIDPLSVYEALRVVNPSPYMFYVDFEKVHNGSIRFLGSSPEALITKNHTHLETVPIAGTRRRGRSPEDEIKMEQELLSDEKELAEHIMLVDLARNDLARISVPGSVETYELIALRKYPHVMHLISKVRAQSLTDPLSILKSMFPAGTVSGAPKKRAMEIIHGLETEDRGPYAGCVGYIGFSGDMDMAISIRTIFNKDKRYIAQAGAGIVADSKPELEYLETQNKMKGTLIALQLAEQMKTNAGGK